MPDDLTPGFSPLILVTGDAVPCGFISGGFPWEAGFPWEPPFVFEVSFDPETFCFRPGDLSLEPWGFRFEGGGGGFTPEEEGPKDFIRGGERGGIPRKGEA